MEPRFQQHRSIVRIQSTTGNGTGFWVKDVNGQIRVLTCAHVIGNDSAPVLSFCNSENLFEGAVPAEVIHIIPEESGDIAVLNVANDLIPADAQLLKLLLLHNYDTLPFTCWGFPPAMNDHGRMGSGVVISSTHNNERIKTLQLEVDRNADLRKGFSGGPLIYSGGYAIGIVNEMESKDDSTAESIHYALSIAEVKKHFAHLFPIQISTPYQAWLAGQYDDIVLNDNRGMRLSDIYIEPYFGVHEYCLSEHIEPKILKNGFDYIRTSIHERIRTWLRDGYYRESKKTDCQVVLLLGYPGQGKTSFTKRLLRDTRHEFPEKSVWLVQLKRIQDPRDLKSRPFDTLIQEIKSQAKREDIVIEGVIDLSHALLVLDGLDELTIQRDISGSDIDDICQKLIDLSGNFPGLKIVLTSRYGYINLEKLKNYNALIFQLSELEEEQQQKWLLKYQIFHPETHLTIDLLEQYNNEDKFSAIKELITQPILLQMIGSLEEELKDSVNRAAIYSKLFDQLVKRPWADGQINALKHAEPTLLREALQDIAFSIYHSSKGYIYKSEIDNLEKVKELQARLGNQLGMWRTVMVAFYMDEIKKDSRKEHEDDKDFNYAIEFLHKSLPEYLCAEKIWRDILEEFSHKVEKKETHALDILYSIFKSEIISSEIYGYIQEIIANDTECNKTSIFQNLTKHFDYFLSRDFYPLNANSKPLDTIKSVFYGYWAVIQSLEEDTQFLWAKNRREQILSLMKNIFYEKEYHHLTLKRSILEEENLEGINLKGCNLYGANLIKANLSRSNLEKCSLKSADLIGVKINYSNLERAILTFGDSPYSSYQNSNLEYAQMQHMDLSESNLANANLENADLSNSSLCETSFEMSNLEEVNLGFSDLRNATMYGANLRNSNMKESCCIGTDFQDADLSNANLEDANFSSADLQDTNLDETILTNVNLHKTNLRGAQNLTIEQLQSVKTLYQCTGIPPEMEASLRETHPHLFTPPA